MTRKRCIFIGGSPCSGKSLLAERLSQELDLPVYHADEYFDDHARQAQEGTVLRRIQSWSPEQIFRRDVAEMVMDFVTLGYEEFPMIVRDLEAEEWKRGAIVEGCALLPALVATTMTATDKAVFLIPTEAFQRYHYARRSWIHHILKQTSDSEQAWENWRVRDARFSEIVSQQAQLAALPVVVVDGGSPPDEIYSLVKSHTLL